jgi:hypothetical protein
MAEWKNEDDIKAELRELTGDLKKLREELKAMVSPAPKPNPSRAFLHRQSWEPPPRPSADDVRRPKRKPRKR